MVSREPPFFLFPLDWDGSASRFLGRLRLCPSHCVGSSFTSSTLNCLELVMQMIFGGNWWLCSHGKACPTGRSVAAPFCKTPCINGWPINNHIYWVKWLIYIKTNTNQMGIKILFGVCSTLTTIALAHASSLPVIVFAMGSHPILVCLRSWENVRCRPFNLWYFCLSYSLL